ncbi:bis(5'-nucleosyl)-tetraphosphatase (symmetrical) YqeK [Anoxybacillus sp.]|uniref:bis(5'-nucleosyl)-tetraphosphatase (symmetrical) YqeK n=1 Tax=Anoxybacillus sp. TaxID=1872573 RepID=UPI002630139A|nr:bis(5'-nucleosyl)-tetraphosphatase (symmetrical) YqeK [uncultured Anoxybacillus sp.]
MKREEALAIVRKQLKEQRYIHTLGVMETAVELAALYGADVQQAELAAIFHDYAKFRSKEEMKHIIIEQQMPQDLLMYSPELWHAPVGAYLVQTEVGIQDEHILNAIRYHTSGRPNMTLLEKIVYIADYIEPNRSFPGVDDVRALAREHIDRALLRALQNTIRFLMGKNEPIYPDTFHTYNDIAKKLKGVGNS